MSFSRVVVTQAYGTGATGTVAFVLDRQMSNGGDTAGMSASWVASLDGSGNISIALPSTMDAGTLPQGARMRVHERIGGPRAFDRIYYVQIPTSGPVTLNSLVRTDDNGAALGVAGLVLPNPRPGSYFFPVSGSGSSTSNGLTNSVLRLTPWIITQRMAIDRIGAEVTVVGEAGSKFRLGIYADNGFGYPGALVLDAGQIAGDAVAVAELACSLVLPPGIYWIGGAVQSAPTTQPTMRTVAIWLPPVPVALSGAPAAGINLVCYSQTGVSGALPANYSGTGTSGFAARPHVRTA